MLRQFDTFDKNTKISNIDTEPTFVEGKTYCFTIVAKDKNNNVISALPYTFQHPAQWDSLNGFTELNEEENS